MLMLATALGLALAAGACSSRDERPWFRGDLDAALATAADTDRMVMVEFFTDWCVWCRRLEEVTFADPEVIAELERMVAIRLDAEGRGRAAASRYGVDRYPTVVFLDATGVEVDRILGFLPPERFLGEVVRIREGR
jgi:thiol:disulfide interchange protein DsbD